MAGVLDRGLYKGVGLYLPETLLGLSTPLFYPSKMDTNK